MELVKHTLKRTTMTRGERAQRYHRQLMLEAWGEDAQRRLEASSVLVVGAGGLGCPAMQYLAAAGVGRLGIVDNDTVSLSNLHRQILFTADDIGRPKADTAAKRLNRTNPHVEYDAFGIRLDREQAGRIMTGFDIVLDGSDNFITRHLVADACTSLGLPLVYGAVFRFEGQLGVVHPAKGGIAYGDIFPMAAAPGMDEGCIAEGVMGMVPGVIGTLMAAEAAKILAGKGSTLYGKVLVYHGLECRFYEMDARLAAGDLQTALNPQA